MDEALLDIESPNPTQPTVQPEEMTALAAPSKPEPLEDIGAEPFEPDTVFDEKSGLVYEVPAGADGQETQYLIGTEGQQKPKGDFFGMEYLGDVVVSGAKGVASAGLTIPSDILENFRTMEEMQRRQIDPKTLDVTPENLSQVFDLAKQLLGKDSSSPPVHTAVSELQDNYDKWLSTLKLEPAEGELSETSFEFMAAGTSVAASIGLTLLTRKPALVGPLFGLIQSGQTMREGREAGAAPEARLAAGAITGSFTALTESLGGLVTLRNLSMNQGLTKAAYEAVNNMVQEAMQTGVSEGVSTAFQFKDPNLMGSLASVFKSAVYGAFWGGTAAGVANHFQRSKIKEDLVKEGLTPEQADETLGKITQAAFESPAAENVIKDIWRHEFSPNNITPEERAKGFKEVEQFWKTEVKKQTAPEPEKSAVLEKVARSVELSKEEATAFPEYILIQRTMRQLDEQIKKTKDPGRRAALRATKDNLVKGLFQTPDQLSADTSTAEEVPPAPITSGADRSVVAEKVARGLALTEEERTSMPELAEIADELDAIDDQLDAEGLDPAEKTRLERERAGALAKVTFEGDTGFDFGANVEPTEAVNVAEQKTESDDELLLRIVKGITSDTSAFTPFDEENQPTGEGGETRGVRIPSQSDLDNDPDLQWARGLGWEKRAKRKADVKLLEKAISGAKLPAASQQRLDTIRSAWRAGANESPVKGTQTERRLKQSTIDKQKASLAKRVEKAATLAERKRVRQAAKSSAQNAEARAAFQDKFPELSVLEADALARSLQRQSETANQAVKAERKRAAAMAEGKELNQKASRRFKENKAKQAEERILNSAALKRLEQVRAEAAKAGARFKRDELLTRMKLVRAIKSADIKNILAVDRHKIEALQKYLPEAKTVSLLKKLNDQIQQIKQESKAKFNAIKEVREAQHQARFEALLNAVGVKSPEDVERGPQTAVDSAPATGEALKLSTFTAKRVFRDLGDAFVEILYKAHNRTFGKQIERQAKMEADLEAIKKKHGVTAEELAARTDYDGIVVEAQEAVLIFAVQSNAQHRAAITDGNKIPLETQEKIIAGLSPKMKALAADLAAWYETYFEDFAAAVLDVSNGSQDLTKVKGVYMPMLRQFDSLSAFDEDIEQLVTQDFDNRNSFARGPGAPGQTKERVNQQGKDQAKIELRAFDVAYRYTRIASTYIEMQRNLRELARLVNEPALRTAIEQKKGKAYVKYLDNYMKRIMNPSYYKDRGAIGAAARALREHASVIYIAGNIVTIAKQPVAMALYLGNNGIGPSELAASIGQFISDPKGTVKFMLDNDPQMRNRAISREAEEQKTRMKLVNPSKTGLPVPTEVRQATNKLVNWSFAGLNWMQTQVDAIGWTAAYNKALEMGKSEADAIEAGQAAVLETQNATAPKDSAELFYSNDGLDLIQQFTDQLNKMYNIMFADIPHNWKKGDKEAAMMATFGLALAVVLERLLANGELPEEPEDWYEIALTGGAAMVPIIGPTATSIYHHYNGSPAGLSVPAVAAVDVARAAEAIYDGDYEKAFLKILRPLAVAFKVPYPKSTIVRGKEMIETILEQAESL